MKILFTYLILLAGNNLFAQAIDGIINPNAVENIEKVLSSDAMRGRATFTPDIDRAAAFIETQFKAAGLKTLDGGPSYLQPFSMINTKLISATGNLDGVNLPEGAIAVSSSSSHLVVNENSGYEKVFIKAGGNFLDLIKILSQDKKNYLVLVDTSFSKRFPRLKDFAAQQFKSPRSVVIVLTAADPSKYSFTIDQEVSERKLANVVGILPGRSKKDEYVIFSGHYDHLGVGQPDAKGDSIFNGANDDASGTAVSLEAARVLSRRRWPATLVFAAVAGEEQGLLGSAHLAKLAKDEGWQLAGVFNNDIVGGDTTPGDILQDKSRVRVFSQGIPSTASPQQVQRLLALGLESDGPSRELARTVAAVSRTYLPSNGFRPVLEFRLDRFLRGGDHLSFNKQGFAAVRFTEWRENFDHQHQNVRIEQGTQYGDLLRFVDPHYVANVARLNAAVLAALASAPAAPVEVHILTANLDNNSTLQWKPGPGMPAGSYFDIVWRDTAAPDWQFHQPVPAADSGSMTIPVSKDNVIFGVRACTQAGACSPAVPPLPQR